jgi:hypothetical protein
VPGVRARLKTQNESKRKEIKLTLVNIDAARIKVGEKW